MHTYYTVHLYYGSLNVDGAGDNDMAANMLRYETSTVAITTGELLSISFLFKFFYYFTASRREMRALNGTWGFLF